MKIIDLFAGCGGLSLGFKEAGFEVVLAIEKDTSAAETYKYNHPDTKVIVGDITAIHNPKEYTGDVEIDGIVGGPSCQGYSLSGKRDPKDPRNSLFMDFLRFVELYNPKFFVMENVQGMLSMKTKNGENVVDIVDKEIKSLGYNYEIYKLNAAEFGVPQSRIRIFFIGIREDIEFDSDLLEPKGFLFGDDQITLEEAIMDLPQINACEGSEEQFYDREPTNDYQREMRNGSKLVRNHVAMKHTKRIIERFKHIGFGQSVADVPEEFGQRKRGNPKERSGKSFSQNNMRPFPDKPSPTIPASFQSNFVHPYLHRNFTAREGARLQSFPDTYIFKGNRTNMSWDKTLSQYQQIGNAVPPLLAKGVAESIKNYFALLECE